MLDAAQLLQRRYHLVITNVPYLARGKQNDALKRYCEIYYPNAKNDLANVFLERCLELSNSFEDGIVQVVMPQNWIFLKAFESQRKFLLESKTFNFFIKLGGGAEAFDNGPGNITNICLFSLKNIKSSSVIFFGLDTVSSKTPAGKARAIIDIPFRLISQEGQLSNPDFRIILEEELSTTLLNTHAEGLAGILNGDSPRFLKKYWEIKERGVLWSFQQTTQTETSDFGGLHNIVYYDEINGHLREKEWIRRERLHNSDQRGQSVLGKHGVAVSSMGKLPVARFLGSRFDSNVAAVVPRNPEHLPAIWCFCSSPEYNEAVRQIDQALKVTNATLVKVPFDLAHWQQVAAERYPHGLPKPYSDDPTQWLFHGHPLPATDPLQVAVARLVGYRWPAEQEAAAAAGAAEIQAKSASSAYAASASSYQNESIEAATTAPQRAPMELSEAAHAWIARCAALDAHTDDDGICCLPSVRGEAPAHERLLQLLIASWETVEPGSWRPAILDQLLTQADCAGKGLDVWLREKFFEQHAKRFHHRPFVWHVWDGLKDGFAALVNYHRLDAKNLERLIHTYLGAWIGQQEKGVRDGVDGAQTRLAAAQDLKRRLELILEGEPPYDIFVRWKRLAEQPIGWNPDLNDGVRLNIRPFMTAEVLRHNRKPKLNITWDKDRGKDVESAPWFKVFGGDRINDHHLTLAEKRAAQKNA